MKCRSMSITMSVYLFNGINGHFFYRSAIISETEREGIRMSEQKAYLLLANGQVFEGKSFGVTGTTIGEVVFATGMTGYQETLTDPSYYGQIAVQTFPLNGNYGTNSSDYESPKCWLKGYIVREWCEVPSNFRCEGTIDAFLKANGVIGLYGIDTRQLTRVIRESGVMNGMITTEDVFAKKEELLMQIQAYEIKDAVETVSTKEKQIYTVEEPKYHVVMMDFGYKRHILQHLKNRNCNVTVVPYDTTAEEILALRPDGVMLTNGPGNPAENTEVIQTLQQLIAQKIPMFGICLGHQLTALANGGETVKLKYGHRGGNQPVKELKTGRVYVTSQNHGYAVVGDSIDPSIGIMSHWNANDKTCEGVEYKNAPVFTVQFHPEACGGPRDTSYLFDRFMDLMDKEGK